jgi:DNA repair exonuclease SbcCD nuclease subunit
MRRFKWKWMALLLLLLLAGSFAWLRERELSSNALVIAVVADPHLAPDGYRWSHAPEGQVSEAQARHYLGLISNYHPDFVVVLGDLIAIDAQPAETKPMWEVYRELFLTLPFPVYSCLGNHDWEWQGEEGAATTKLFQRYIGERTRAWRVKGVLCLILDPHLKPIPRDSGKLSQTLGLDSTQLARVKDELHKVPPGSKVLVFYHEPMVDWSCGAAELVDLLDGYDASLFAGHYHCSAEIVYQDVPEHVIGAFCGAWWRGPNRDLSPPGFLLLRVGQQVESRWIPLEVPTAVAP